jgi:DNA repair exonuclease SbcCD ATPase subunit
MPEMPRTRAEIEARMLELNEERDRLRQELDWVQKQIEAVQAICDHPETYFRCIMGREDTDICKVCGKHHVPAAGG